MMLLLDSLFLVDWATGLLRTQSKVYWLATLIWGASIRLGIPVDRDRSFRFVVTGDSGGS